MGRGQNASFVRMTRFAAALVERQLTSVPGSTSCRAHATPPWLAAAGAFIASRHGPPAHQAWQLPLAIALSVTPLLFAFDDAQGESPTAHAGALPACDIAPRSRAEIDALLSRDTATPAATTGGLTLPAGVPASGQMAAEIESVVGMWLACHNQGDPLRAWALFSDGYLYRLISRQAAPDQAVSATPVPAANSSGGARLVEIRGERRLPDGRYGATVTVTYPSVPMPRTFFFYFTEVDGRLVIDGILGEISFSVP